MLNLLGGTLKPSHDLFVGYEGIGVLTNKNGTIQGTYDHTKVKLNFFNEPGADFLHNTYKVHIMFPAERKIEWKSGKRSKKTRKKARGGWLPNKATGYTLRRCFCRPTISTLKSLLSKRSTGR